MGLPGAAVCPSSERDRNRSLRDHVFRPKSVMKSFLNACGFSEPLRLTVDGPRVEGEARTLPQPFAVIGRDPQADVILDDLRVSRRHIYIQAVAGRVFWVDLESRTGTCDETGTRKSGWLADGGLLEIGPFVI